MYVVVRLRLLYLLNCPLYLGFVMVSLAHSVRLLAPPKFIDISQPTTTSGDKMNATTKG